MCLQTVLKIYEHACTHAHKHTHYNNIHHTSIKLTQYYYKHTPEFGCDIFESLVHMYNCYRPPVYRIYTLFTHRYDAT